MYSGFCSALDSEHLITSLELSINMKEDKNVHFFLLLENENHFPVCPTTPLTPKYPPTHLWWPGHSCLLFSFIAYPTRPPPPPNNHPQHHPCSSFCFAWVISDTVTRKQWMSCVAGVTLFKNKCTLHCLWDILQKAYFSFSVGSWCQSSAVLICHQIKELTEHYWLEHLVVSPLIMMLSPFASFLAYKLENSPFRILWNIKSLIFATNVLVSPETLRHVVA